MLQDAAVIAKMSDTKAAGEVKVLEQFYMMLQCEPAKAFYGKKHVLRAAEAQSIETLLISDNLFRWVQFKFGNKNAQWQTKGFSKMLRCI